MSNANLEIEKKPLPIYNLVCGVVFLIFSLLSWFWLIPYKIHSIHEITGIGGSGKDPRIFPKVCVAIIFVLGLIVLYEFFMELNRIKKAEGHGSDYLLSEIKRAVKKYIHTDLMVLALMGVFILYAVLINVLGFAVTSFLAVIAINKLLGAKGWIKLIVSPAILVALTYILFATYLDVSFPKGILF